VCAIFLHPTSLLLSQSVSNHVLLLSDSKDAARLEDDILSGLTECTIEAWIRWDGFNRFAQPWSFGTTLSCVGLNTFSSTSDLQLFVYENTGTSHVARASRSVELHQWYHLAAVINTTQGLQLYMNGVLIAKSQQGIQEIGSIAGKGPARAGVGPWEQNGHFIGALDELRIWDHARSPDQIRATMQQQASGTETGLRGLWNFDPTPPPASSPILKSAQLEGDATLSPLPWESLIQSPNPMIIQGEIKDESGNSLANASVELKSGKTVLNRITSDSSGQYAIVSTQSIPPGRPLELVATHLTRGVRTHIDTDKINESGTILQNLTLNPALHLEGSVFTLNNVPFPFVLVEALAEGNDPSSSDKESFFTWSDADGNYRFVNLPKQKYRLRVHLPQTWMGLKRTFSEASGMIPLTIPFDPNNVTVLDTRQTPTYRDLDFHIPAFRKGRTTTFDLLSKVNKIEDKAFDNELNESSVETVQLRVLPEDHLAPWYRTSEFITLASIILFILLVVVIALLAKYYQHKRRMFRERELHMLEVEQKNTELELAKDEALRALHVKSEFLSTVSHEIRTPMNGMLGMNFLLLNTQLNDEQRDYAETVKHCGEVLLKTINDILDLSKMEAGKLKLHQHPFKFKETLRDALKVTEGNAKKKELLLHLDCDPGIPEQLLGDSQRLS
jgi:signal transduction histidine kinase